MMKSLLKLCLFSLLLIFWMDVRAQSDSLKVDSLKKVLLTQKEDTNKVNALNALSKNYLQYDDSVKVLFYANNALMLAEKISFKRGMGYSHFYKGFYYYHNQNTREAEKEWISSTKQFQNSKDTGSLLKVYSYLTDLYDDNGNYSGAIAIAYKQMSIAQKQNNKSLIALCYQVLGFSYGELGDSTEAKKDITAGLKINEQIKDTVRFAQSSIVLSQYYVNENNYQEAGRLLTNGLRLAQKIRHPEWLLHIAYAYNGSLLVERAKLADRIGDTLTASMHRQKALTFYDSAIEHIEDSSYLPGIYLNIGSLYKDMKKMAIAKSFFEKGLLIARKYNATHQVGLTMEALSEIYSLEGDYKKGYEYYKNGKNIIDSILGQETLSKAIQQGVKYENDKKESLAKAIQDKKDAEAKRIKNQQYFAIAALGIVVLAVVIIALIQFRNNKQKQKANTALQKTLTNLKSTQAQLIQSKKMASLGELTAGIAHEIQNPLNFVNNFSEVNQELISELVEEVDKGNTEEVKAIANDIKDNEEKINHHGKRADAIVKGMLEHSKTSTGKKELTDINKLADEYLRLSYHGLRAKDKEFNADFKTDFDENIGKINIIPQDIGRVLLNLINNAFYATNEKQKAADENYKPLVTIQTKKLNDKVEIKVSDNGNGIPQNIVDKIFQPFFTTKPTGQGTGLGLSLSYDIIKAHSGEIKVNTKENEGATFIIQIPV